MSHENSSVLRAVRAAMMLCLGGGLGVLAPAVMAQSAGQVAANDEPGLSELQEVVVTSTRQAQPLSKVPISVEAFTEKAARAEGRTRIR
jgi:outer membrane receptor protein involved in Fe transport